LILAEGKRENKGDCSFKLSVFSIEFRRRGKKIEKNYAEGTERTEFTEKKRPEEKRDGGVRL